MCTVSIEVNEKVLRGVDPNLDSTMAIRKWVQQLVNVRTQEMIAENRGLIDVETMRENLHQMVKEVYAQP